MNARLTGLLCMLIFVIQASAATALGADSVLYEAEVTGTDVNVRSGRGTDWYRVTKLSGPARVRVVGEQDGWVEILPPANTFSVISNQYVEPDEDGQAGTVTGNNVWVRAGGELHSRENLKEYWALQVRLDRGDRVQILGKGEDYYKIVP